MEIPGKIMLKFAQKDISNMKVSYQPYHKDISQTYPDNCKKITIIAKDSKFRYAMLLKECKALNPLISSAFLKSFSK